MRTSAKIVVLGGGYVGQLVQLAVSSARVLDNKPRPADHLSTRVGPQYLWAPIPGVESTSFPVWTLVDGVFPTPERILAYKKKVGKEKDESDWGLQFRHQTTGWQSQLPVPRVDYEVQVMMIDLNEHRLILHDWSTIVYDILVSTIPMPVLMSMLVGIPRHWLRVEMFQSDPIYIVQKTDPEVGQFNGMTLNYISVPDTDVYRETWVGDQVFQESLKKTVGAMKLAPGKIHRHTGSVSIRKMLSGYDCFCFGRYANWEPEELAHETWEAISDWSGTL